MVDAHAHLAFTFTIDEFREVYKKFEERGGTAAIDTSTEAADLPKIKALLDTFPTVYAVIGLHPEEFRKSTLTDEFMEIEAFLKHPKVIGIGETGIDYTDISSPEDFETQKMIFGKHIDIANKYGLPLVIHARGKEYEDMTAYNDVIEILEESRFPGKVYFHSFGGNLSLAKRIIEKGYVIGVNGISTYSGAKMLAEVIEYLPLTSILLETDTPYLIPSNLDRNELLDKTRNEPTAIWYTAKRIAKLKNLPHEEVLTVTERNTRAFFERMS